MSEGKEEKTVLELTTEDGYEVLVEQDTRVARILFQDMEGMMAMQDLGLWGPYRKRADKWMKQKNKLFLAIQTMIHKDPKCMALVSRRDNGTYWVHDIIPLCMIMEQPFRHMMMNEIKLLAEREQVQVIVPQVLKDLEKFELTHGTTMEEINKAFDHANDQMMQTGEKVIKFNTNEIE